MLTKFVPVVAAVTFALALAAFVLAVVFFGLLGLGVLALTITSDAAPVVVFGLSATKVVVAGFCVLLLVAGTWLTRLPKLR